MSVQNVYNTNSTIKPLLFGGGGGSKNRYRNYRYASGLFRNSFIKKTSFTAVPLPASPLYWRPMGMLGKAAFSNPSWWKRHCSWSGGQRAVVAASLFRPSSCCNCVSLTGGSSSFPACWCPQLYSELVWWRLLCSVLLVEVTPNTVGSCSNQRLMG